MGAGGEMQKVLLCIPPRANEKKYPPVMAIKNTFSARKKEYSIIIIFHFFKKRKKKMENLNIDVKGWKAIQSAN